MIDAFQTTDTKGPEHYWGVVRRRRWWFLVPCFAAWAIFLTVLYVLPARYRSEATILVSGQSVPDKYVPSNVPSQLVQRLQSMTQQILSQGKLEKIIEDFRLYEQERVSASPAGLVQQMRKNIDILPVPIDDLAQAEDPATAAKRALAIAPATGKPPDTLVFRLSFTAKSSRTAEQVNDALVSLFIEENMAIRQRESETTTNFLQSQVEEVRKQLEGREAQIREFKSRHLGQLPEQKESNVQILSALQSRLQTTNDALAHAEQQQLYLTSLSEQYKALEASLRQGDAASLQSPAAIDKELERLRTQLTGLRGQYTDRHPDVITLEQQIAQTEKLKSQIENQIRSVRVPSTDIGSTPHPNSWVEMQQMSPMLQVESQLKSTTHEIEASQNSIKQMEKEISEYQTRLDMTPTREEELDSLKGNYDQVHANFQSLLTRQNESQVATNLERRQEGQQFVVLNAPSLPEKPNAPDRFMFSLIGLGVGVGLGLIVGIVSELADGNVHSAKEVKGWVTVPVLAGIPMLVTAAERRSMSKRSRLEWASGSALLAVMAIATAFMFYHG
jgi:succinoglycan biosynthesis transport protein ExoP